MTEPLLMHLMIPKPEFFTSGATAILSFPKDAMKLWWGGDGSSILSSWLEYDNMSIISPKAGLVLMKELKVMLMNKLLIHVSNMAYEVYFIQVSC